MPPIFPATLHVFQEGDAFVAHALQLDVSSCGDTDELALGGTSVRRPEPSGGPWSARARWAKFCAEIQAILDAQLARPDCRLSEMMSLCLSPTPKQQLAQVSRKRWVCVEEILNQALRVLAR